MKKHISFLILMIAAFSVFAAGRRTLEVKKPRMNGEDVKAVQNALLDLGFSEVGEADGYYGPMSEGAVKELKKLIGVSVNGYVDDYVYDFIEAKDKNTLLIKDAIKIYNANKNEENCVSEEEIEDPQSRPFSPTLYVYKSGKKTAYCRYEESYDFYGRDLKIVKVSNNIFFFTDSETTAFNPDGGGLNSWDPNLKVEWKTSCSAYIMNNGVLYEITEGKLVKADNDFYVELINFCKNKF